MAGGRQFSMAAKQHCSWLYNSPKTVFWRVACYFTTRYLRTPFIGKRAQPISGGTKPAEQLVPYSLKNSIILILSMSSTAGLEWFHWMSFIHNNYIYRTSTNSPTSWLHAEKCQKNFNQSMSSVGLPSLFKSPKLSDQRIRGFIATQIQPLRKNSIQQSLSLSIRFLS